MAPKVRGLPLIGSVFQYIKNPLDFYVQIEKEYGTIARYDIAHLTEWVIYDPVDIKRVLFDNADNYDKSSGYDYLKEFLGVGILTADQNDWSWRRKLAAPSFTVQSLKSYGSIMSRVIEDYADRWERELAVGQVFSLYREMNRLALEIAGVTMFGSRLLHHSEELSSNLYEILLLLEKRIFTLPLPLWIPAPHNLRYRKVKNGLRSNVSAILDDAQELHDRGEELPLLVRNLLEHKQNGGMRKHWSMLDEAITFLLAGHETTGSALAWAFYLIFTHPDVEARLREEIDTVLAGRTASVNDIPKLIYTAQIAMETLRLYPSIWTFGRRNIEEDELAGYRIPPGTDLAIVPYVTHRNPLYWERPEQFDPDRFAPGNEIDKFHYYPFATGPRNCIGHKFAMQEMVLVLATFVQRFRLKVKEGFVAVPEVLIVMRPGSGMPMSIAEKRAG